MPVTRTNVAVLFRAARSPWSFSFMGRGGRGGVSSGHVVNHVVVVIGSVSQGHISVWPILIFVVDPLCSNNDDDDDGEDDDDKDDDDEEEEDDENQDTNQICYHDEKLY